MFCVAICHIHHKWWHVVWVGQAGYNQCKELAWCSICSDMTKIRVVLSLYSLVLTLIVYTRGRIRGDTRQLEKNRIFWCKIVIFFTRNTPNIFALPSARRNYFYMHPLNLKSWIRPCICRAWMTYRGTLYIVICDKLIELYCLQYCSDLLWSKHVCD